MTDILSKQIEEVQEQEERRIERLERTAEEARCLQAIARARDRVTCFRCGCTVRIEDAHNDNTTLTAITWYLCRWCYGRYGTCG